MLLIALALCARLAFAAAPIAITGGTLIDGNGGQPLANATVLIRDERIVAVGPAGSVEIPADAQRYDATGKYVLPGFMDMHMHLVYPHDATTLPSNSLSTLRGLHFMEMYVDSGVTSVRDVAGMIEPMQALEAGQDLGYIHSLRLFSVGQLITTTGG